MQGKKAELALVQSNTIVNNSTKAIAFLFPEVFHLMVRQDAGINDISDIEGKRIALMSKGSGSYNMFWRLQEHYQLDVEQIKTIPLPITEAHQALEDGEVDGLFRVVSLENPAVIQLLRNPQIKKMMRVVDDFYAQFLYNLSKKINLILSMRTIEMNYLKLKL